MCRSSVDTRCNVVWLLVGMLAACSGRQSSAVSGSGSSAGSMPIAPPRATSAAGAVASPAAGASAVPSAGMPGVAGAAGQAGVAAAGSSAASGGAESAGAGGRAVMEVAGSQPDTAGGGGVAGNVPAAGSAGMASASAGSGAGAGGTASTCEKIPPASQDCSQPLAPGDARKCQLTVSLQRRSYYLYAPRTYDPCKPTALVIDCHGALETAEAQAGIDTLHIAKTSNGDLEYPGIGSGWRLEADTPGGGFIVVTPQGIDNVWTTLNNDPQFFLDIVAATKKIANIAADKVYMSGISNGSIISYETACQHTDVFSGIAAHSAGENCTRLGKPIPVISFDAEPDFAYGTTVDANDTMVRLNQCKGAVESKWLTIDSTTTDTVCRNDPFDMHPMLVPCNTIAKTSITTSGIEPTVCKRWGNCNGDVAVAFCDVAPSTLHGSENAAVDAHILYGNATSLNTPSVAWRFFKSFWK